MVRLAQSGHAAVLNDIRFWGKADIALVWPTKVGFPLLHSHGHYR
jgi:hypothetical protein